MIWPDISLSGGGAGKPRRSRSGCGEGLGFALLGQRGDEEECPHCQHSMQRRGSRQSTRRWRELRHLKQRPWKRLKKAARASAAAREELPCDQRAEADLWVGRRVAGSGEGARPRSRLEVTSCHSGPSSGAVMLTSGAEGWTATDWSRGRATHCWDEQSADERAAGHGSERLRPRKERSSSPDLDGSQGAAPCLDPPDPEPRRPLPLGLSSGEAGAAMLRGRAPGIGGDGWPPRPGGQRRVGRWAS